MRRLDQVHPLLGLGHRAQAGKTQDDHRAEDQGVLHRPARVGNQGQAPLFEGAQTILRQLVETGFALAVATGKSRRGLDGAMNESGVAEFFTTSRCGEETAPKPDPTMLRDILLELDISPHETLMVGDTEYDLMMAAAARTYAGAATYGAHSRQRLLSLNPAIVIDTLAELPAAISQLNLIK